MPSKTLEPLVLVGSDNGLVVIPQNTPLRRLNYFDGKFLRASDLQDEQNYLRQLVQLSNQAGGSGVVHGFDLTLGGGDTLNLGPGLAINPDGRVLLLPQGLSIVIQELIDKSQQLKALFKEGNSATTEDFHECDVAGEAPPITTTHSNDLYLIVISPADALCGEEDVYGKLCEEACATSTDRPFALEGVIVRAIPLVLKTPLPHSTVVSITTKGHLRSRVASAYFEDERQRVASMISKFGLEQQMWCLGADAANGAGLPIGVIARAGSTTVFLDAWIARRERIETSPRRYWQWRMMMRPWDVFLAQILQFQCQLRDLAGGVPTPGGEDPCGDARSVIVETASKIADLVKFYKDLNIAGQTGNGAFKAKLDELAGVGQKLTTTEKQMVVAGPDRLLIRHGIIEIPSAGYLPVSLDKNATVNQQVRQWMGDGVDLRFCVVRPDYVAHALEEAQHLERISLIAGLDDPKQKPQVDILVPNGEITEAKAAVRGGFEATVTIVQHYVDDLLYELLPYGVMTPDMKRVANQLTVNFNGVARQEEEAGGINFFAAMMLDDSFLPGLMSSMLTSALFGAGKPTASKSEKSATDEQRAAELRSSNIFSRLKTAAARKREQPAQHAGAEGVFKLATSMGGTPGGPSVGSMLPAGLWLAIYCDKDPRKLQTGQTLRITGRAVVGAQVPPPFSLPAFLDLRLWVEGNVSEAVTKSDGSHLLTCRALTASGSIRVKFNVDKESEIRDVDVNVTVSWGGPRKGIEISVHEPHSGVTLGFKGDGGGLSLDIGGIINEVYDDDPNHPHDRFKFQLHPNPEALKEGSEKRQRAVGALQIIGSALNSSSFVPTASAQLFPPPSKPTDELIVRGTQDWVMFHRRRSRNCGTVQVAPAARRYRVYQVAATPEFLRDHKQEDLFPQAPPTTDELLSLSPKDFESFKAIGEVTFGGGLATFVGDVNSVKNAWQKIPGGQIVWAAIGSRGDAMTDGESLSRDRLKALESELDQVSPSARADVLPIVPPPLDSADVDGVIVLINEAAASRTYRVFELTQTKLQQNPYTLFDVNKFLNDPNGWTAVPTPVWGLFDQIAEITFGPGAATLSGDTTALTSGWKPVPSGSIVRAAIVSQGDAEKDAPALSIARVKAVEAAVDSKTHTDPNARVDILSATPLLSDQSVDGVILFLNGKFAVPPLPYGAGLNAAAGSNAIGGTIL
jgi:hypothetical protein